MIDIFTVMVPHALMAIAVWRLIHRDDLDFDPILPGTAEALARLRRSFASTRGAGKPRAVPGKDRGSEGQQPRA